MHSEQLCEQLSTFLDGELPQQEIELLLRRLDREPQLRSMLSRYAAIGECMRGEPDYLVRGFDERVAAGIAHEKKHQVAGSVIRRRRSVPQWLRTAGAAAAGLGIAAAVAAVAIVSLQRQEPAQTDTQIAVVAPEAASSETVVIGDIGNRGDEALSYTVPEPATSHPVVTGTRLADYVLAHSEYSSALGRRNVLSGIIAEDPTPIDAAGAVQSKSQAPAPQPKTPIDEPRGGGGGLQMAVEPEGAPRFYFETAAL